MKKKHSVLVELGIGAAIAVAIGFGTCGASGRPAPTRLRESAVQLYLQGSSTDEVARSLDISRDEAKRLLGTAIDDLHRAHARP